VTVAADYAQRDESYFHEKKDTYEPPHHKSSKWNEKTKPEWSHPHQRDINSYGAEKPKANQVETLSCRNDNLPQYRNQNIENVFDAKDPFRS
jgi:hypothetical protein